MKRQVLKKQLEGVCKGDLVRIDWADASVGKSMGMGLAVDVPVKSWGVFIGLLGKRNQHIVLAQNNFQYSDGLYDIDYTAIPVGWAEKVTVIDKQHVSLEEAEQLFTSFLRGGRRSFTRHKQQKVKNHN
ncbi:MAG: hypothetical protein OEZ35_00070 [Candidatus Bathyarchaeota archaeon]|nr:hypothetical protein [Candidatus Bathyarchaeota archaeon]